MNFLFASTRFLRSSLLLTIEQVHNVRLRRAALGISKMKTEAGRLHPGRVGCQSVACTWSDVYGISPESERTDSAYLEHVPRFESHNLTLMTHV